MAIDKQRAEQLRLEGKTHQEVADALGCSIGWCKKNLVGVKQPNRDKPVIDAVRKLGRSAQGVTTGEIKMCTITGYPELVGDDLEDKVKEIRKQARRGNPDVIIRPYWMLPDQPRECTLAMLEYASELWQFKEYLANKYQEQFDMGKTFNRTVVHALTMMSAGEHSKLMPQGLMKYGETLQTIQDTLVERNNPNKQDVQQSRLAPIQGTEDYSDMPEQIDFIYSDDDFSLCSQLGTEVYLIQ